MTGLSGASENNGSNRDQLSAGMSPELDRLSCPIVSERIISLIRGAFSEADPTPPFVAAIGIQTNDPQYQRFLRNELDREAFAAYCVAHASNVIGILQGAQLDSNLGLYYEEVRRAALLENGPAGITFSASELEILKQPKTITCHAAALAKKSTEPDQTKLERFEQRAVRDGLPTGIAFMANNTRLPLVDGKVIYQIEGNEIVSCDDITPGTSGYYGLVRFKSLEINFEQGKLVLDRVAPGDGRSDLTHTALNQLAELGVTLGSRSEFPTMPVIDGRLVTEIDGQRIIHAYSFSVENDQISGEFLFAPTDRLPIRNRTVVNGKVLEEGWNQNKRGGDLSNLWYADSQSEYEELLKLEPDKRLAACKQGLTLEGFIPMLRESMHSPAVKTWGPVVASLPPVAGAVFMAGLGLAEVPVMVAPNYNPIEIGASAASLVATGFHMALGGIIGGAAGILVGTAPLTLAYMELVKKKDHSPYVLALKGLSGAETLLEKVIERRSSAPGEVLLAATILYPDEFLLTMDGRALRFNLVKVGLGGTCEFRKDALSRIPEKHATILKKFLIEPAIPTYEDQTKRKSEPGGVYYYHDAYSYQGSGFQDPGPA